MSLIFETFEIPLWLLVFVIACAVPLWIDWYKKFVVTGILEKKLQKVKETAEEKIENLKKADILKKATNNWNDSVEHELNSNAPKKSNQQQTASTQQATNTLEQPYIKIVLKILALKGDAGMLLQSIADSLEVNSNEIKNALKYLEDNDFVEVVTGGIGTKYYLTVRGRKHCIKQGYI